MKGGSILQNQLDNIARISAERMADVLIFTSVAGWVASSGAQLIGIAKNKDYTKEQKHFLLRQESADAAANIGLFFLITKSFKKLASKMVSTGKIIPKAINNFLKERNLTSQKGRYDFDITKVDEFKSIRSDYNCFNNLAESSGAVVGGILSSNILTPILRNSFASKRHNNYSSQNKNPYEFYKRHTFDEFKNTAMSI